MPVTRDPSQVAARWAQNLGSSVEKVRQGVQAVTTAPTAAAANAADLWQSRLAQPDVKAKYQRNLQRVSLTDWQSTMINKGIPRIASGAQAAKDKFTAFLQQFLPFQATVTAQVHSMPKTTLEDRINRAVAQIRGTAQFRKSP